MSFNSKNKEHRSSLYENMFGIFIIAFNPLIAAFIEAGVELGWSHNDEYN
jgi:hypothetical protein